MDGSTSLACAVLHATILALNSYVERRKTYKSTIKFKWFPALLNVSKQFICDKDQTWEYDIWQKQ